MLKKTLFALMFILAIYGCDNNQSQTTIATTDAQNSEPTENNEPEQPPEPVKSEVEFLDQGLSDEDRLAFYYLSQGSQLLPYSWFLALETENDQNLFRSDKNMRRLGYIPNATDSHWNPDGLPIGFVKNDDPESVSYGIKKEFLGPSYDQKNYPNTNTWLGFTCANCHTSNLSYQGKTIRIDGGSSQSDHQAFLAELVAALQTTVNDDEKMTRFAHRVLDPNWNQGEQDALKDRVAAYTLVLAKLRDQNQTEVKYGFGRLDAFGAIFNRVLETGLEIPANHFPSDAPVSYPFIWDTPKLDWVQYNSSAGNPIARNVGEVLGVYAHLQLQGTPADGQFDSTARIRHLERLEGYVNQIKSPPWPEQLLGSINKDLAQQGQELYQKKCAGCHYLRDENGEFPMTTENKGGVQFIKTNSSTSLADLGTDPKMVQNFLVPTVDPGILRPLLPEEDQNKEKVARVIALQAAVRAVINRELSELGLQGEALKAYAFELSGRRTEPFLKPPLSIVSTYKARPLNGIWATGPYLHNGSVANLYELLLPAEQRAKTFHVGSSEFDPKKVGFITTDGFLFETLLPGNSNAGHSGEKYTQIRTEKGEFREFTEQERYALVEYMKTLN